MNGCVWIPSWQQPDACQDCDREAAISARKASRRSQMMKKAAQAPRPQAPKATAVRTWLTPHN